METIFELTIENKFSKNVSNLNDKVVNVKTSFKLSRTNSDIEEIRKKK